MAHAPHVRGTKNCTAEAAIAEPSRTEASALGQLAGGRPAPGLTRGGASEIMRLAPEASVTKLCLKDAMAASLSPSAFIFASKAGHCFGSAGLIPHRLLNDWPMVLRRRSGSEVCGRLRATPAG